VARRISIRRSAETIRDSQRARQIRAVGVRDLAMAVTARDLSLMIRRKRRAGDRTALVRGYDEVEAIQRRRHVQAAAVAQRPGSGWASPLQSAIRRRRVVGRMAWRAWWNRAVAAMAG